MNNGIIIEKVLQEVKNGKEIFLGNFSVNELDDTCFTGEDDDVKFQYTNVYLLYDGQYKLKIIFENNLENVMYVTEEDVGGLDIFKKLLNLYFNLKK
jgi:hypothetical protein